MIHGARWTYLVGVIETVLVLRMIPCDLVEHSAGSRAHLVVRQPVKGQPDCMARYIEIDHLQPQQRYFTDTLPSIDRYSIKVKRAGGGMGRRFLLKS